MRKINEIIVHASATPPNMDIGVNEIKEWHLERGFSDIGYHYVIRRNGEIEAGRPLERMGAHTKGHNEYSIGVCLVGGITESGIADANFTFQQYVSLYRLVTEDLLERFSIDKISGHREYSKLKACPCFNVKEFFKGVI